MLREIKFAKPNRKNDREIEKQKYFLTENFDRVKEKYLISKKYN